MQTNDDTEKHDFVVRAVGKNIYSNTDVRFPAHLIYLTMLLVAQALSVGYTLEKWVAFMNAKFE